MKTMYDVAPTANKKTTYLIGNHSGSENGKGTGAGSYVKMRLTKIQAATIAMVAAGLRDVNPSKEAPLLGIREAKDE